MPRPPQAYLTVIAWPNNLDEPGRVDALTRCAGMDRYQARLASRRNTPGIMRRIDAPMRGHVLNALHARGIMAFAPTRDEIEAYPDAVVARGVDQFPNADPPTFVVKCPDGQPWTFRADEARLVVTGRITATRRSVRPDERAVRGMLSIEHAVLNAASGNLVRVDKHTSMVEMLDLHIASDRGPRLVRLMGPRARIGILGDDQRHSLLDDTRPAELAEVLMPRAEIDTEFHDFDPPADLRARNRSSARSTDLTLEYWVFYSAWRGLIRRAVSG
ncbi:MAG: hypothetical protein WD114_00435 [Phycisphaerales bacterium]